MADASEPRSESVLGLWEMLREECLHVHPQAFEELKVVEAPRTPHDEAARLAALYGLIHARCPDRRAICLSGGGIRSASFALGVLQGLARLRLLEGFDYLSTVSGGGYIGSWLSAWSARASDGEATVVAALANGQGQEPPEVEHLREYSNYLTPALGLLSADTWTLVATYVRNLLLTWLTIVPLLALPLVIPRLAISVVTSDVTATGASVALRVGAVLLMIAIAYVDIDLPSAGNGRHSQASFLWRFLLPLAAGAILLCLGWGWLARVSPALPNLGGAWSFMKFGVVVHLGGWVLGRMVTRRLDPKTLVGELLAVLAVGALAGWLLWKLTPVGVEVLRAKDSRAYICFAPPALLCLYFVATALYVGLSSKWTSDEDREWFARAGAWILIAAIGWTTLAGLALFGPRLFGWLSGMTKFLLGAAGGVGGLVALVLGRSAKTAAQPAPGGSTQSLPTWAPAAGAAAFAVGLFSALALGVQWTGITIADSAPVSWVEPWVGIAAPYVVLGLGIALVALVAGWRVNVNRFSLHAMYRNRLIRAYLRASRPGGTGQPNLLTGFDPADNLPLHALRGVRPFHVVNVALNLVHGRRLAWQHRKAESFTFSPLHSGSATGTDGQVLGYRPTESYGGLDGVTLGTAMAISGAAASPNMGYHSSPAVTFVMTLFNARLGWWLGNPGRSGRRTWRLEGPRLGFRPILAEAFGLTDDRNSYVYLSDGGHFENLALYEMVLRRCGRILVVDSGCDGAYEFEDLGNAVRKIRVDLGIPIEFDDPIPEPLAARKTRRLYRARIRYGEKDPGAPDGVLLYVKPALDGGEPADVRQYAMRHPDFPHQSTADQWFDEEQFESYRMLGFHTVLQTMRDLTSALEPQAATATSTGA